MGVARIFSPGRGRGAANKFSVHLMFKSLKIFLLISLEYSEECIFKQKNVSFCVEIFYISGFS
jgi:hypothetical protein